MEPNPATGPLAHETDARTLFAARLAALTARKPEAEDATPRKRGAFLTRRFFGGRGKDAAPAEDVSASPPGNPEEEPVLSAASVPGALADGLSLYPPPPAVNLAAEAAPETPAPSPPAAPSAATNLPEPRLTVPTFHHPPPVMNPTPTTDSSSATAGRAATQLTLGFEITSLQLTPFFRLGSVQLKALSDVASLHLVADGQADGPLAAGISFRIERVELDDAAHLKAIVLRPLGESREVATPLPQLQVDSVAVASEGMDAPISVKTSGAASTAVQLIGTFALAAMEFSPAFEVDSMRLEPASNTVRLRVAPTTGSDAPQLPSSFELAEVQLDDGAHWSGARLVPAAPKND